MNASTLEKKINNNDEMYKEAEILKNYVSGNYILDIEHYPILKKYGTLGLVSFSPTAQGKPSARLTNQGKTYLKYISK